MTAARQLVQMAAARQLVRLAIRFIVQGGVASTTRRRGDARMRAFACGAICALGGVSSLPFRTNLRLEFARCESSKAAARLESTLVVLSGENFLSDFETFEASAL